VTDHFLDVYKLGSNGTPTGTPFQYNLSIVPRGVATAAVLTRDGKHLLVAAGNGIDIINANAAEAGASSISTATLTVPGLKKYSRAINVAVTPDGKFAFVSLQFVGQVGVFDLTKALGGQASSSYIGSLDVGPQPVGLTVSPDGKTLYATNFVTPAADAPGKLTVVDVAKATTAGQQKAAVVAQAPAGCGPARIAVTQDGKNVFVTTKQSNFLLGYSASLLRSKPSKALIAKVQVGQNPVGLALRGDSIYVADTAEASGADGTIAIVDTTEALARKNALSSYVPGHHDPHEIALAPSGQFLYAANRASSQIQVIDLGKIP